jgi:zinc metalloprotease ZmpA
VKRRTPLIIALAAGTAAASAMVAAAGPATAQPVSPAAAAANAASGASALVASRPAILKASADDAFVAGAPTVSHGLHYTPYSRTYKGLHVTGGDLVIATDDSGAVKATSVAQDQAHRGRRAEDRRGRVDQVGQPHRGRPEDGQRDRGHEPRGLRR